MNTLFSDFDNVKTINELKLKLKLHQCDLKFSDSHCHRLRSKKHFVIQTILTDDYISPEGNIFLKNTSIVIKIFSPTIEFYLVRWENEFQIQKELIEEDILTERIPVLFSAPGIIIYQYIMGQNIFQLLISHKITSDILLLLSKWIRKLHKNGYIFGDLRLKNFLFSDSGKIIPVDFEDVQKGEPLPDITEFLCSFIDYSPGIFDLVINSSSLQLLQQFLDYYLSEKLPTIPQDAYSISQPTLLSVFWKTQIYNRLKIIAERRRLDLTSQDWEYVLKLLSEGRNIQN